MATKNNTHLFHDFVEKMLAEGFKNFIIDFFQCKGMDSTFMGILLEISNFKNKDRQSVDLTLTNMTRECKKCMDSLGISKFLKILKEKVELPKLCFQILEGEECSRDKMIEIVKKAHEALILCNPVNEEIFREFLEELHLETQKKN